VAQGMTDLVTGLHGLRSQTTPDEWREFSAAGLSARTRSNRLFHQDPMTRRAFEKATRVCGRCRSARFDLRLRPVPAETSSIGAAIYGFTVQAPAASAVRVRRDMLARKIDEVAARIENPRILSVACGHLREAQKSTAVAANRVGELFALDQDKTSLETVAREQTPRGITPVYGSVKSILKGETVFSDLDLVYSTGLYDYLPQPVAIDLTTRFVRNARPAERLVLANLLPDFAGLGYMETFMGWPMIYRTVREMADVALGLAGGADRRGSRSIVTRTSTSYFWKSKNSKQTAK
jgi:hypothetical protein